MFNTNLERKESGIKQANSLRDWLLIISLIFLYGYQFPFQNHLEDLPPIKHLMDASLFQTDYYVLEMLKVAPRLVYYHTMAFVSAAIGIENAFLVLWLISIALTFKGLLALSKALFEEITVGVITILLLMLDKNQLGTFGQVFLINNYLIANMLAAPFVVWGLYYTLKKEYWRANILLGLAILVQFLYGFYGFLFSFLIACLQAEKGIKRLVPYSMGIVAAAFIFLLMSALAEKKLNSETFIDIFIKVRTPHHNLVSNFLSFEVLYRNAIFYATIGIILWKTRASLFLKKLFLSALICLVLGLLIAYISVELIPLPILNKLQMGRFSVFPQLLGFLVVAQYLNKVVHKSQRLYASVLMVVLVGTLHYFRFIELLLVLLAVSTFFKAVNFKYLLLGLLALLVLVNAAQLLQIAKFNLPYIFGELIVVYGLLLSIALLLEADGENRKLFVPFLISIALAGFCFSIIKLGVMGKASESWARNRFYLNDVQAFSMGEKFAPSEGNLREVAAFAKANIEKKSAILTPIDVSGSYFKLLSERPVFVDFKNIPYTDKGILEWSHRIALCCREQNLSPYYNLKEAKEAILKKNETLKLADKLSLAQKEKVPFVLVKKQELTQVYQGKASLLFENKSYALLKLTSVQ